MTSSSVYGWGDKATGVWTVVPFLLAAPPVGAAFESEHAAVTVGRSVGRSVHISVARWCRRRHREEGEEEREGWT